MLTFSFFLNSAMLGLGLGMDAFSVSLANGLNEPKMKNNKAVGIAALFAFFQYLMPLLGWLSVHTVLQLFGALERAVPWVAFILLLLIGGKMIIDGVKCKECENKPAVGIGALMLQGIATSIDALSTGFAVADYCPREALLCGGIIAGVTFILCLCGVFIGKKFGTALSGKASVLGGVILIAIGIKIFISGIWV